MHELGIANAVIGVVRAEAARRPGTRPVRVGLRVGELAGVDPDALSFCFESLLCDTDLRSLALEVETVRRRHRCSLCRAEFDVVEYNTACPACGTASTVCIAGEELLLSYLEMEDP